MNTSDLRSFPVVQLMELRDEIETIISSKIHKERGELERQLAKIQGYSSKKRGRPPGRRGSLKGTKVAPKYRNPKNRSETWAGRGAQPRWLQAALRAGGKIESFLIHKPKKAAPKKRKKAR